MAIQQVSDGVWETISPVSFYGIPMAARTTLIRLGSGKLFVHSPGALTDEVRAALDSLGEVGAIVAPNLFHHLFVDDWREVFPGATVHIPEALAKKRPDLAEATPLGDHAPASWEGEVEAIAMEGLPMLSEHWFFHRPSRTLIDTDLMHNMQRDPSFLARTGWKLMDGWKKFGPTRLERIFTRDRAALRSCVERALEWDFARVVVAHGDVVEAPDVHDQVRASWRWLE